MLRFLITTFCLSMLAISPAVSYDGMEVDFTICTESDGTKEQIVEACTRLIDNAATENSLVGYFYAFRASANDDRQSNCRDAHKVLELAEDPQVIQGANTLVDINC